MSTFEEINKAVQIFRDANCPFELMHCNSTYPMKNEMANLRMMQVCETDIIVTLVIAAMKPAASFLLWPVSSAPRLLKDTSLLIVPCMVQIRILLFKFLICAN